MSWKSSWVKIEFQSKDYKKHDRHQEQNQFSGISDEHLEAHSSQRSETNVSEDGV
jgi:hypothetical protein